MKNVSKKTTLSKKVGHSYIDDDGTICMIRCLDCGRENWAMAVAAGHCTWCGYNPNSTVAREFDADLAKVIKD